jgi:EmrB/QacA subfamily drug resistance transporter
MIKENNNVQQVGSKNRWKGLIFIGISLLIISLDNTVLNVALPAISRDLGASASELQWIVDAYILVFAAVLLTMGSVGDRFGRKRALQGGILWFGLFSLLAAISTSTTMLIGTRALLGLGGATIMPATLSLVTASFREPKERAQAIALWAAIFGLGAGIGPLIGGFLLEHFSWHAVFFVNIPVIAIALIGGQVYLEESRDVNTPPPDVPGVLLSIPGLFALVYGIIEAGQDGWTDNRVLISFGITAVLLSIFGWWENRAAHPMLPMYLFRNMSFTGANVAMTMMFFGLLGILFFFSQYFQSVQGYTALQAGWRLLPQALVMMVSAASSARIAQELGLKRTVSLGFMIAAGGMFFMSQVLEPDTSYWTILLALIVLAFGMGIAMSPATDSIMGSVPVSKAGIGSAMNDTTRQIGGAMGVAVLGTIMNHRYLDKVSSLKDVVPAPMYEAVGNSIQGAHAIAAQLSPQVAGQALRVANDGFVAGMSEAMLIAAFVMAGASLFTFLFLPSEVRCIEPECAEAEQELEVQQVSAAAAD